MAITNELFFLPAASAYSGDCMLFPGGYFSDGLNWAADNFEIYPVGDAPSLPSPVNNGDTSLGTGAIWTFVAVDSYAYDLFEAYAEGAITTLTLNTDVGGTTLGTGYFH